MFKTIRRILALVPGAEIFGVYRFLPFFLLAGAGLEFTLIHWHPRGINFYDIYTRKEAREIALNQLRLLGELEGINEKELKD